MLQRFTVTFGLVVGWLTLVGYFRVSTYLQVLGLPRPLSTIQPLELPSYGWASLNSDDAVWLLGFGIIMLGLAILRVVFSYYDLPYRRITIDKRDIVSRTGSFFRNYFASVLDHSDSPWRRYLAPAQVFVVVIIYAFGITAGLFVGLEEAQRALDGQALAFPPLMIRQNVRLILKTDADGKRRPSTAPSDVFNAPYAWTQVWQADRRLYFIKVKQRTCWEAAKDFMSSNFPSPVSWTSYNDSDILSVSQVRKACPIDKAAREASFRSNLNPIGIFAVVTFCIELIVLIVVKLLSGHLTIVAKRVEFLAPAMEDLNSFSIPANKVAKISTWLMFGYDVRILVLTSTGSRIYFLRSARFPNGFCTTEF